MERFVYTLAEPGIIDIKLIGESACDMTQHEAREQDVIVIVKSGDDALLKGHIATAVRYERMKEKRRLSILR